MAQGGKYATLPDLDYAPDIYETIEPTADNSRGAVPPSPASTAGSESFKDATSTSNSDEENNGTSKPSRVDRQSTHLARARDAFSGSRIDARGVDFSDRIASDKRSYRVSRGRKGRSRRLNKGGGRYVVEYGDFSDDEEEESFAEKVARLKREVEEARVEAARIVKEDEANRSDEKQEEHKETEDAISELSAVLSALQSTKNSLRLHKLADTNFTPRQTGGAEKNGHQTQSLPLEPQLPNSEGIERTVSKAAEFESRLNVLELSLGSNSATVDVGSHTGQSLNKNVLTALSTLESQLVALSNTTLPAIDSMDHQIRQLAADAVRLEEARSAARTAQDSIATKSPSSQSRPDGSNGAEASSPTAAGISSLPEDAEQAARISALYNTLPTIEALAPLVPSVLERLRSLRVLHVDAAAARETLVELEKAQAKMEDEIRSWREGLDKAEKTFGDSEQAGTRNSSTVEKWVRDLETRLDAFGA